MNCPWPIPNADRWMHSSKSVQLAVARDELAQLERKAIGLERDFLEHPNPATAAAYEKNRVLADSARRLIVWLRKPAPAKAAA